VSQETVASRAKTRDEHVRKERFLELLSRPAPHRTAILGVVGAVAFFGIWEIGHYLTPKSGQRFLPAVEQVVGRLVFLFWEKEFLGDVLISCMRIFVSFFAACVIAVPLGIAMGCFANVRALINPTVSGWRYLPAASFIPLLLVWFGPTEMESRDIDAGIAQCGAQITDKARFVVVGDEQHVRPQFGVDGNILDFDDARVGAGEQGSGN